MIWHVSSPPSDQYGAGISICPLRLQSDAVRSFWRSFWWTRNVWWIFPNLPPTLEHQSWVNLNWILLATGQSSGVLHYLFQVSLMMNLPYQLVCWILSSNLINVYDQPRQKKQFYCSALIERTSCTVNILAVYGPLTLFRIVAKFLSFAKRSHPVCNDSDSRSTWRCPGTPIQQQDLVQGKRPINTDVWVDWVIKPKNNCILNDQMVEWKSSPGASLIFM